MNITNLNALGKEIRKIAIEHGHLIEPHSERPIIAMQIPTALALIHSEVSEALEAYRDYDLNGVGEELVDVIIRCLDLSAHLQLDIDKILAEKIEKNRNRPYKHGRKIL